MGEHLLAPDLVHGQRGRQHAGSHVGQSQHLHCPLHGAVLPERSMQHREHHERRRKTGQHHEPVLRSRGKLPGSVRRELQLPAQHLRIVAPSLPVQTHDRHPEPSRVQVFQNRSGRDEGNVMLGGASSAEDHHMNPAVCHRHRKSRARKATATFVPVYNRRRTLIPNIFQNPGPAQPKPISLRRSGAFRPSNR